MEMVADLIKTNKGDIGGLKIKGGVSNQSQRGGTMKNAQ